MRKFWPIFTVLIIFTNPIVGLSDDSADFFIWSDFHTIYNFSDRWRYEGDYGYRQALNGDKYTLYVRPSFRYRVNPWFTVHGGIRFFQTFNEDAANTFEIGPWQGLLFLWPKIGGYTIRHYLRLDDRMIWQTQGESDFDFTLRARYRLGVRSPNFDILFKNGTYPAGSIEAFADLESPISDTFVNRLRYFVGPGFNVSDAWHVETLYGLQQGRSSRTAAFTANEQVLRLRFFYSFN